MEVDTLFQVSNLYYQQSKTLYNTSFGEQRFAFTSQRAVGAIVW